MNLQIGKYTLTEKASARLLCSMGVGSNFAKDILMHATIEKTKVFGDEKSNNEFYTVVTQARMRYNLVPDDDGTVFTGIQSVVIDLHEVVALVEEKAKVKSFIASVQAIEPHLRAISFRSHGNREARVSDDSEINKDIMNYTLSRYEERLAIIEEKLQSVEERLSND